jgi:predicted ATPase
MDKSSQFIESIDISNFLSFGNQGVSIGLKPLNILIGANGSGKSNFLDVIDFLRSMPGDIMGLIRDGGGVLDWLHKNGKSTPIAKVDATVSLPKHNPTIRYAVSFTAENRRFVIEEETIENKEPSKGHEESYFYYKLADFGRPIINVMSEEPPRKLEVDQVSREASIMRQRRDPDHYPEITSLADELSRVRMYREWSFGRYTTPRQPQKTDLPNAFLEEDASNLGMVLSRLLEDPETKQQIEMALHDLYEAADSVTVSIFEGRVQVIMHEGRRKIPATRLSDGTLRYLCLLAILLDSNPAPLVCIEEPELGMHPDVLPTIAKLLKQASQRTQLIVTTHSDVLVDCMTDDPECIVIAEAASQGTSLSRLNGEKLRTWLENYRLGELWKSGELGGNRW